MNDQGGVNKIFLIGEVSRRPRWHKNGQDGAVLSFTLTTRDSYLQRGQLVEHQEEHALKLPENKFTQELMLGQKLHIEGKLKTISYTDEQLVKRYRTEVIVIKLEALN